MPEPVQESTLVNGKLSKTVSVRDRGLLYADGVFETIAVSNGTPVYWNRHMTRLETGCDRLGLPVPDTAVLAFEADRLVKGLDRAVLRLMITRGEGGRGYRPPAEPAATRIVQCLPYPAYSGRQAMEGVRARLCSTRLGRNPQLAGIKHMNRLEQVIARREWDDDGIAEGLLLDSEGDLVEGTLSNVFFLLGDKLLTPRLSACGVAGIMRTVVAETAEAEGVQVNRTRCSIDDLSAADEVFLCNSLIGIWPVKSVDGQVYPVGELTQRLQTLLENHNDGLRYWLGE